MVVVVGTAPFVMVVVPVTVDDDEYSSFVSRYNNIYFLRTTTTMTMTTPGL
jgi:hypothetical protein